MRYSLVVENFRGGLGIEAKANAAVRVVGYLDNSGDTRVETGNWEYRVLIQEQHGSTRLEELRIEWPWTFRLTLIPGHGWDVRWRGVGDEEIDRGVTYTLEGAIEVELESFLRERRAAASSKIPATEPQLKTMRLWAPPGVLRDIAKHMAQQFENIVAVEEAKEADLTIEPEQQVEGGSKEGVWYGEGHEENAIRKKRVQDGTAFEPSAAAFELLGWSGKGAASPQSRAALVSEVRDWLHAFGRPIEPRHARVDEHAFISYVSEDAATIDRLQIDLESAGVKVWRDRTSLDPGEKWKNSIRRAIRTGTYFICCFSRASEKRARSYMREELTLAVDELRLRNRSQTWFLPVVLKGGEVPDWPIGGGETLRDFNYVLLTPESWSVAIGKLLNAMASHRL